MATVEKAGMLVNADKEVVGWVNAGDEVEMQEGDVVVSHFKTAEKMGLKEKFDELKAENKPKKEKAEKTEGDSTRAPRVRIDVPETGAYTVAKADFGTDDKNEGRAEVFKLIQTAGTFDAFFQNAKPYVHTKRDGTPGADVSPKEVMSYAIRRGVVTVG